MTIFWNGLSLSYQKGVCVSGHQQNDYLFCERIACIQNIPHWTAHPMDTWGISTPHDWSIIKCYYLYLRTKYTKSRNQSEFKISQIFYRWKIHFHLLLFYLKKTKILSIYSPNIQVYKSKRYILIFYKIRINTLLRMIIVLWYIPYSHFCIHFIISYTARHIYMRKRKIWICLLSVRQKYYYCYY